MSLAPSQHFYHFALSVPASSMVALEKQSKLKDRLETSKGYLEQGKMEKSVQILRSLQEEPEFKHDDTVLNQLAECAAKGQKVGLRECWMHSSYHLDKPEGTGGATALRFNSQTGMLAAGHRDGSVLCFDINAAVTEMRITTPHWTGGGLLFPFTRLLALAES